MLRTQQFDPNKITTYFKGILPPDIQKLKDTNQKFTDPYFPPNEKSLLSIDQNNRYIDPKRGKEYSDLLDSSYPRNSRQWKRACDIKKGEWKVFTEKIEFDDVKQGSIGDCYFLSGIASLTEFPNLIIEKFRTKTYNDTGYYEIVLFIDGEWQIVFIDDYFPCYGNNFVFARPNGNELWAILLEKAWAKANGGYTNITGGMVQEILQALTGFTSEFFKNNVDKPMMIYNKIEKANDEKAIMGCGSFMSSTGRDDSQNAGNIIYSHAYSLIDAKSLRDDDIYLLKVRNPWGKLEWNGDWSDGSRLWNERYRNYFGQVSKDDGIFFMNIDDYIKNFEETNICHILYGSKVKSYDIEHIDYFKSPIVFNIQMNEAGQLLLSVIPRDRRFNRVIPEDEFRPFSLMLFKYDENYKVTEYYGGKWSILSLGLLIEAKPGIYCAIVYIPYQYLRDIGPDFKYTMQIASTADYVAKFAGKDTSFKLLEYMLISYFKKLKAFEMQSAKQYILTLFKEIQQTAHLLPIILYNKVGFDMRFDLDFSKIKGYEFITRYTRQRKVTVNLKNGDVGIIIPALIERSAVMGYGASMRNTSQGVQMDNFDYNPRPFLDPSKIEEDTNSVDGKKLKLKKYIFITNETAEAIPDLENINKKESEMKSEVNKYNPYEDLKKDYPKEFEMMENHVKDLPETVNNRWMKIKNKDGIYAGQIADDNSVTGRGLFIYQNNQKYIGRWNKGKMDGYGILFGPDGKLIYQGDFDKGIINGNGKFHHNKNQWFNGRFKNNKMEGFGTYHYETGHEWQGMFKDHMKNSVGLLTYPNGEMSIYVFKDNKIVEELMLNDEEKEYLKGKSQQIHNAQDRYVLGNGTAEEIKKETDEFMKILENAYKNKKSSKKQIIIPEEDKIKKEPNKPENVPKYNIDETQEEIKIENEDKEREEKKKRRDLRDKVQFLYDQTKEMNPFSNDQDFQLFEKGDTKYLKNFPEGSDKGYCGYFDGTNYYIGQFEGDLPNGKIRKFNKEKNILMEGKMRRSFKFIDDDGIKYFSNGDVYRGPLKSEMMEGSGFYTFANGDQWKGTFSNDKLNGQGILLQKKGLNKYLTLYQNGIEKIRKSLNFVDKNYVQKGTELPKLPKETKRKLFDYFNRLPIPISRYYPYWAYIDSYEPYLGQINKSGVPNGRGILCNCGNDGSYFFVGTFEDGIPQGKGFFLNRNVEPVLEGNYENGKLNGFGRMNTSRNSYEGNFENNVPHKYGCQKFPGLTDNYADGIFKNGEEYRLCKVDSAKGTKQIIEFENGNITNIKEVEDINSPDNERKRNIMNNSLKFKYKKFVDFYNGMPNLNEHIKGIPIKKHFIDGFYIGDVNHFGKKNGKGVLQNKFTGDYYVGYFRNNMKNGNGKIYSKDDKLKYEGEFKDDAPCGNGKYYNEDGTSYAGNFNENGAGKGRILDSDGNMLESTEFYGWIPVS